MLFGFQVEQLDSITRLMDGLELKLRVDFQIGQWRFLLKLMKSNVSASHLVDFVLSWRVNDLRKLGYVDCKLLASLDPLGQNLESGSRYIETYYALELFLQMQIEIHYECES